MKKVFFLALLVMMMALTVQADSIQSFIAKYRGIAQEEMHRTGIPASIILGQAILESDHGMSKIARYQNNYFGMKHGSSYKSYSSPIQSFEDHARLLSTNPHYSSLRKKYSSTDYGRWADGLESAKYATNPNYSHDLIVSIERNNLTQYDE